MKKYLIITATLIILSQFIPHGLQAQQTNKYSKEVLEKIKQFENNLISWVKLDSSQNWNIYDRMKEYDNAGISIAVIHNYKIEWVKSYGLADKSEKRPVTNQTLFQAASIGKSINGFGIMKLVQQKKVELNRDINDYLKTWKFPYDTVSKGEKITLAQLLSHTAGLSVHGFDGYKWNDSLPTIIQSLNGEKPANNPAVRSIFEPELKFEYSGGGNMISQLMLEDITNKSHVHYMKENVFEPLHMKNTFYAAQPYPEYKNQLATAYRFDGKDIGCKYHIYPEHCGAALWTTAEDLAKFIIEIQLSLKGKSNKILNPEMTKLMLTPHLQTSNSALGFFIDKKGNDYYFQHSGWNEGFCSQYYGSMEGGNGVVVLLNSEKMDFREELINSIATVYGWKDFYPFVTKRVVSVADSIKDKYIGTYQFENSDTKANIVKENGKLYLQIANAPSKWNIYFTSNKEFFMLEAKWANQEFFTNENGNVKGFYILSDNSKITVNKIE